MVDPTPYKGCKLYPMFGPEKDVWQAFLPDGRAVAITTLEGCKRAVDSLPAASHKAKGSTWEEAANSPPLAVDKDMCSNGFIPSTLE